MRPLFRSVKEIRIGAITEHNEVSTETMADHTQTATYPIGQRIGGEHLA